MRQSNKAFWVSSYRALIHHEDLLSQLWPYLNLITCKDFTSKYSPNVEETCLHLDSTHDLTPVCNGVVGKETTLSPPQYPVTQVALSPVCPAHCPALQATSVPTQLWCLFPNLESYLPSHKHCFFSFPITVCIQYYSVGHCCFLEEKRSEIFFLNSTFLKSENWEMGSLFWYNCCYVWSTSSILVTYLSPGLSPGPDWPEVRSTVEDPWQP